MQSCDHWIAYFLMNIQVNCDGALLPYIRMPLMAWKPIKIKLPP